MFASTTLLSVGLLAAPGAQASAEDTLLVRAERLVVRPGVELADAAILVQRGVIVAVGPGLAAPEGAREIAGKVVCAAFLDPWSTLGLDPGAVTDPGTSPASATVDALDPWFPEALRREVVREGVTTARVQAGGGQVAGLGAVIRNAPSAGEPVVLDDACVAAAVGLQSGSRTPDVFDRVEQIDRIASLLEKGQRYREAELRYRDELAAWERRIAEKRAELEKDFKKAQKDREKEQREAEEKGKAFKEEKYKEDRKPKAPRYDAESEVLARVVDGELALVVEAHRAAEIRNLLDVTARFDRVRLVIAGATEALEQAPQLRERHVPVILWPAPLGDQRPDEYEAQDLATAGELARAGVEVLIGSGGVASRELRLLAALAVGHGLDRAAALGAITEAPARVFDVGERLGTIERGKDAELLILDGDPLDTTARIRFVVSGGRVVYEAP